MSQFLVGLFTHNVVTKVVSLLLAIVLFVFVQQSISETQRIERLVIQFELDSEVDAQWVLLQPEVTLRDITVSGLRESLTREMSGLRSKEGFRLKLTIDQRFLNLHDPDKGPVRIDAALCRQEGIPWQLGKDFELRIEDPPTLDIQKRVERTFQPALSEEERKKLVLPPGSSFVLKSEDSFVFNAPLAIAISGPASAMPSPPEDGARLNLWVRIRPLAEDLKGADEAETRDALFVEGIDWEASKFDSELLEFIRVESPDRRRASELARVISYNVLVEPRRERLDPIPLQLSINAPLGSPVLEAIRKGEYVFYGPIGVGPNSMTLDAKLVSAPVALEVTPNWARDPENLAKFLWIRVDLTNCKLGEPSMSAPVTLVATLDAPAGLLREVRFAAPEGEGGREPTFLFKKP